MKTKEEILNPIMDEVEEGNISPYDLQNKLLLALQEYADQFKIKHIAKEDQYSELHLRQIALLVHQWCSSEERDNRSLYEFCDDYIKSLN